MYHGMNPSIGDGFLEQQQQQQPQSPQRLLAVILWFQLALCFGPAQLTGGFDDLQVCADPGVPENGFRTPSGGVFFEGSVTRFHCQDGFKLKGATKRLCMKYFNGTLGWIPSDQSICVQEDCRIPQIEDAEIHNKTYRYGEKLIVTCHEGFKIRYPDLYNMFSLCRDDGTWNNLPICQGCLRPLASTNGYVNISEFQTSFPVGTVISYRCFPGFKLDGSAYLECLHNLIWSSSPPRCLALEVASGAGWVPALLSLPSRAVSREHSPPRRQRRKLRSRLRQESADLGARPVRDHEWDCEPAAGSRGTLPETRGELREATAGLLSHYSL